jgi:hypothetical protein
MNGYIAFYINSTNNFSDTTEVFAQTLFEAKEQATNKFKEKHPRRKIQSHHITVMLAQKEGIPVIHTADF